MNDDAASIILAIFGFALQKICACSFCLFDKNASKLDADKLMRTPAHGASIKTDGSTIILLIFVSTVIDIYGSIGIIGALLTSLMTNFSRATPRQFSLN